MTLNDIAQYLHAYKGNEELLLKYGFFLNAEWWREKDKQERKTWLGRARCPEHSPSFPVSRVGGRGPNSCPSAFSGIGAVGCGMLVSQVVA